MKIIKCPKEAGSHLFDYKIKVFLAGGITGCPDWQSTAEELLYNQKDLLVMNPRRSDFDVTNKDMEKQQIDWEYRHINYANLMLFWFPCETLCPITLFELGKIVGSNKNFVIGAHPYYKRRTDLIEQLSHTHPEVPIRHSIGEVIDDLKWYIETGA